MPMARSPRALARRRFRVLSCLADHKLFRLTLERKGAALFSLDSFAGGFTVQSLMALAVRAFRSLAGRSERVQSNTPKGAPSHSYGGMGPNFRLVALREPRFQPRKQGSPFQNQSGEGRSRISVKPK